MTEPGTVSLRYLDPARIIDKKQTKVPVDYSVTGYGRKRPTSWMLKLDDKRWYRVYCMVYSNNGSCYIATKNSNVFLGSYDPRDI